MSTIAIHAKTYRIHAALRHVPRAYVVSYPRVPRAHVHRPLLRPMLGGALLVVAVLAWMTLTVSGAWDLFAW